MFKHLHGIFLTSVEFLTPSVVYLPPPCNISYLGGIFDTYVGCLSPVLKMKMLRVVLTQLVLLCPQCPTAKQSSLKVESTLAMYHSERLLHKSMHFAAKQQRPHQLTPKTKRHMHSMVHDAKTKTIEATDQQIRSRDPHTRTQ